MSEHEQRAWEANIGAVWAEEVLRERGGSLSGDQLYHITLLATGDRKRAEKDRARRILDETRATS